MEGIAKDSDTVFCYLSIINEKTQVLTKLINDLFEYCQAELNELKIDKKEVYSGDFLKLISEELSLEFRNSPFIFDKFYRGEKAKNLAQGVSGLGLSICKYIVEKHGGQIFVESQAVNGSNFYFVIPKI